MRLVTATAILIVISASSAGATIAPRNGGPMPGAYLGLKARDPRAFQPTRAWTQKAEVLRNRRLGFVNSPPHVAGASHPPEYMVSGRFEVPVLLVQFSNRPPRYSTGTLRRELFEGPWPTGTLTDYFREVSYGALEVGGLVYSWGVLSRDDTYYEGSTNGLVPNDARTGELIKEVVHGRDQNVDFGLYDNDGPDGIPNSGDDDGFVDLLFIVHSESGGECGGSNIWTHSWVYQAWPVSGNAPYSTNDVSASGGFIKVNDYVILPVEACDGGMIEIGVFAHELGHAFGLPDLFDLDGGSNGVGHWDIMGRGNWNTPSSPAHPSAWTRKQLGWISPAEADWRGTNIALSQIETTPVALQLSFTDDRFRRAQECAIDGSYSLRCGLSSQEGAARNWVGGGGYGNRWGEVIERGFASDGSSGVRLTFDYRYEMEVGYDSAFVIITSGSKQSVLAVFSGVGSGKADIDLTPFLSTVIPPVAYTLKFRFESDDFWSDEDGGFLSTCGPFVVDNIRVLGGGENYSADFESSAGGWHQNRTSNPPTEYFLIENRQAVGFDKHLHGSGLLIWHVDDEVIYSKLGNSGGASNTAVRGLVLEEADGRGDLLKNPGNFGDDGDPYPGSSNNTVFDATSTPNSYDNTGRRTTIEVKLTAGPGPTMSAYVRAGDPPPLAIGVSPDTLINDRASVDVEVLGTGLRPGATFEFTKEGETRIVPVSVEWLGDGTMRGAINVYSRRGGDWNLLVTNPDGQECVLADAITVIELVAATLVNASITAGRGGVEFAFTLFNEEAGENLIISRSLDPSGPWTVGEGAVESLGGGKYLYVDRDVVPGKIYYYKLDVRSADGQSRELYRGSVVVPAGTLILAQNVPNPFNPSTTIRFYLPVLTDVTLEIFDVTGALIKTLASGVFSAGPHEKRWDGTDQSGNRVASGVYVYRLRAGRENLHKKMVLLK